MKQLLHVIFTYLVKLNRLWLIYLPGWIIYLFGTALLFTKVKSPEKVVETLNITFGIVAGLSALAFTYASHLEGDEKDRVMFAGERLLNSCIVFLTASFVQFGSLSMGKLSPTWYWSLGIGILETLSIGLLIEASRNFKNGVQHLRMVLWPKEHRLPGWSEYEKTKHAPKDNKDS